MKIIFARHGESHANILREVSNRGLVHPLTMEGRRQAAALAEKLESYAVTRIFTSPVLRAIETSVIVANRLGVPYEVTEVLREPDMGIIEGRADETAWNLLNKIFESWCKGELLDERFEGGESYHDVRQRFVPFIDRLIQEGENQDANILFVSHGGIYWLMLPLIVSNIDMAFIAKRNGFSFTTTILAELQGEVLVCIEWDGERVG